MTTYACRFWPWFRTSCTASACSPRGTLRAWSSTRSRPGSWSCTWADTWTWSRGPGCSATRSTGSPRRPSQTFYKSVEKSYTSVSLDIKFLIKGLNVCSMTELLILYDFQAICEVSREEDKQQQQQQQQQQTKQQQQKQTHIKLHNKLIDLQIHISTHLIIFFFWINIMK